MGFFLAIHHAMQWALVIPMNLYYSEVSGYHELSRAQLALLVWPCPMATPWMCLSARNCGR